ncbi:MAG: hypothetical protein IIT80_03155, partial [Aeriscardovia sp.]|nr:hypothetical protein [Aeriscardovia sp.]
KKRDEAEKKRDEAEAEWLDAINEADKIRWRCNAARKSEKADEKYLEAEELQEAVDEAEKKRDEAEAEWLDAINEADKIRWRCNAVDGRIYITRFDTKAGREAEWASIESEKADTEMLIATTELYVATGMMSEASKEEYVSLLADDIKHTNEMIEDYITELAERGFITELAERGF